MAEHNWQTLYRNAVLQVDRDNLRAAVQAAEDAIRSRIALPNGQIPRSELAAMRNALSALRILRGEWDQREEAQSKHQQTS